MNDEKLSKKEIAKYQKLINIYYKKFTKLELFHFVLVLLERLKCDEEMEKVLEDFLEIAKERRKEK